MTHLPYALDLPDSSPQMSALISSCGTYRYALSREWGDRGNMLVLVIVRCIGFAKREGYGGIVVVNIWAYRATYPRDLFKADNRDCADNIWHIERLIKGRDVVVAWGARAKNTMPEVVRVMAVLPCAASVRCLGFTKGGQPRHPLMVRADKELEPFPLTA